MPKRALVLAASALVCLGCVRSGGNGRRNTAVERVAPLVLPSAEAPAPGAVRIAAIFPTLGRYAASGLQSLQGARLSVDDLNRAGGVHGRRLQLLEYRTGSYFVDAREAAERATADGALAIVGSNSSELSMAVAEEAEEDGILQISNVSTAQDLTRDPATGRSRSFVFRVCASDDVMGELLASFARDRLRARRAAVLYEVGRAYSNRLARSFIERFRDRAAGRVVQEFYYLALETDFRPQLARVEEFRPDVVFLPGSFTDATLVAAQAAKLRLRATLLGADAWSNPLLFSRGAPPGDAYFVDHCSPPAEFNRRYRATFAAEAEGCRAVLAYDAVLAIATGLRALGPLPPQALGRDLAATRRRLRDAVARADVDGATGRIRFDRSGDSRRGVALYAVEKAPDGTPHMLVRGWLGEP
jgi:branched-chain amino acid transport system substrate-binding protein